MRWCYYLHQNGDLIGKNPDYFDMNDDSTFIKHTWMLETSERKDAWSFILEALSLGARPSRIKELSEKWGLTEEDLPNYLVAAGKLTRNLQDGLYMFFEKILEKDIEIFFDKLSKMK